MLSFAESQNFVKEELYIVDSERLRHTDSYKLLHEITRRLQVHSPFHNFFLMAQDPGKRHKPSWEEIKSRMLTGTGGLCYTKNLFTFYLLQAFGFNVILVMADMLTESRDSKHVALLVQDVKRPGDRYVVDVGMSWPSLEPVDLSFEQESPEFTMSHFRIKYIKEGKKIIRLQHRTKHGINGYTRLYEMSLEAWFPSQVAEYMDKTYQADPLSFTLHQVLCCVQYDDKDNVRLLQDNVFKRVMAMDDSNFEKLSIDGDDALIECILENFPKLSKDIVMKAVVNWRKVCSK